MKKFLHYIIILVALAGIFGPVASIYAQTTPPGVCWANGNNVTTGVDHVVYQQCIANHWCWQNTGDPLPAPPCGPTPTPSTPTQTSYPICPSTAKLDSPSDGFGWEVDAANPNGYSCTDPATPAATAPILGSCTSTTNSQVLVQQGNLEAECPASVVDVNTGTETTSVFTPYSATNPNPNPAYNPTAKTVTYPGMAITCTSPQVLQNGVCTTPLNDPNYNFLQPLPCPTSTPGCPAGGQLSSINPSAQNPLGQYLNLMIKILIGVAAVAAVVMIIMGGIEYMTSELISSKESGKEKITNAIFGLALALGAWTLLNTINPTLFKADLGSLAAQNAQVIIGADNTPQTPQVVNGTSTYGGYATGTNFAADFPNNSIPALPAGVTVCASNGQCGAGAQCVTVGQQNCTSTLGLDTTIVSNIENGCKGSSGGNCQIIITAGTEFWLHGGTTGNTSHHPGSPTVDLSATSDLDTFITGNSSFPTDGAVHTASGLSGVCFLAEQPGQTASTTGPHWHVYQC